MSTSIDGSLSLGAGLVNPQTTGSSQIGSPSALGKLWRFPEQKQQYIELLEVASNSEIIAKLLVKRGITSVEAARAFLDPKEYVPTEAMELPDVDKAIVRISQAIAEKQNITVYGDYDVDGVTGTSVLLTVLRKLGACVDFYIPNRASEGYGLNLKAVSVLASKHRTKLIITCDCGVSNFAEINFAKSLGVDTLVLDHHSMPELMPPAVGIVHPKRLAPDHPLFDLPGVGVAYKVCEALLIDKGMPEEIEPLLDFVTLGMIADLVPLVRENRYLVQIGLPKLVNSQRPGIQALLSQVKKSDDTDLVGFGLAPRINAVGRLSDARAAVELMTTDDPAIADNLAKHLQSENSKRQELCEQIFAEADQMVQSKCDLTKDKAIAIYAEGWHHGVVGIVASRLVDKYHRPVFIAEFDTADNTIRGSARSIEGLDLYEALKLNEPLLLRWGGHKMAAGFTIEAEKGESFCQSIVNTCNKLLAANPLKSVVEIDAEVNAVGMTHDLARLLTKLAPFGMANKKPLLLVRDLRCASSRLLGRDGKHHRIMFQFGDTETYLEAVFWNSRGKVPQDQERVDIVCTPEINTFNGRDRLQLVLADWRGEVSWASLDCSPDGSADSQSAISAMAVNSESFIPIGDYESSMAVGESKPLVTSKMAVPSQTVPQPRDSIQGLSQDSSPGSGLSSGGRSFPNDPSPVATSSLVWKDLRGHSQPTDILIRASQKLGNDVAIFSEAKVKTSGVNFVDRTALKNVGHLIFAQFPPSLKVFQEIINRTNAKNIYLVGSPEMDIDEPGAFLKRLVGLAKFAINQRQGQVEGEKLAALMGSSKMSLALGLTVLRKVNLIDWFAEDGNISLDLLGDAVGTGEDLPEFRQMTESLSAAREFREWCQTTGLKDIQLSVLADPTEQTPLMGVAEEANAYSSTDIDSD
jgi:single-stranded-DNA-specific exonuclease RecJ